MVFRAPRPILDSYPELLKTVGDHIRKSRLDKKLFQPQVAKLIGVDVLTITNWELGNTEVSVRYLPRVIRFLAYNPLVNGQATLGERFKAWRTSNGLTFREVIKLSGMDNQTLQRIEADSPRLQSKTVSRATTFLKAQSS